MLIASFRMFSTFSQLFVWFTLTSESATSSPVFFFKFLYAFKYTFCANEDGTVFILDDVFFYFFKMFFRDSCIPICYCKDLDTVFVENNVLCPSKHSLPAFISEFFCFNSVDFGSITSCFAKLFDKLLPKSAEKNSRSIVLLSIFPGFLYVNVIFTCFNVLFDF